MKDDSVHEKDDSIIEEVLKEEKVAGGIPIGGEKLLQQPYLKIKGPKIPANDKDDLRKWANEEKSLISTSLSDLKSRISEKRNVDHVNVVKKRKQATEISSENHRKLILELLEDCNSKLRFKD